MLAFYLEIFSRHKGCKAPSILWLSCRHKLSEIESYSSSTAQHSELGKVCCQEEDDLESLMNYKTQGLTRSVFVDSDIL